MAKNMARIDEGIVVNIEWCSYSQAQTVTLIDLANRPVAIGDTYTDGKFYRDGIEVLAPEEAQLEYERELVGQLQTENATLISDMAQMIDEVYQSDLEMMGL